MPLIRSYRNQLIVPNDNPVAQHPGWIPGRYYGTPTAWVQDAIGNHLVNGLNWQHFPVLKPLTIDAIGIRVSGFSGASVRVRMGVYNVPQSSPLPTTKVLDSGIITITSTGVKQAIFTPLSLLAGMYAIAFIFGDANTSLSTLGTAFSRHQSALYYNGTDSPSGNIYNSQNYSILPTFDLPDDLTSLTTWLQRLESPTILVRAA